MPPLAELGKESAGIVDFALQRRHVKPFSQYGKRPETSLYQSVFRMAARLWSRRISGTLKEDSSGKWVRNEADVWGCSKVVKGTVGEDDEHSGDV
jgi:hypothetical protein